VTGTAVRLVLGSASPARLATLRAAGLAPEVVVSGVDESLVEETDPARLATRLAELKAAAVADRLADADGDGDPDADAAPGSLATRRIVLGCDSVLELEGAIFGKPADPAEAEARWRRMRGRHGVLHTGHCLVEVGADGGIARTVSRGVATGVSFAAVTDEEIAAYVDSGEPLQVAGAFTLDGLGGAFVSRIDGDPHNVVGVSLPELRLMLAELEVRWTDLWA
jgi:septum formation protein